MSLLPPFLVHRPEDVAEAVRIRAAHPDAVFLAGGTDLLVAARAGRMTAGHVVSLDRIPGLRGMDVDGIGAMVRLAALERSAVLGAAYPALREAAASVASPLVRNAATVGGNILLDNRCYHYDQRDLWRDHRGACLKAGGDLCHVVPQKEKCYSAASADLPPAFIALDAALLIVGPSGARETPISSFYTGDGLRPHSIAPDEILVRVVLPETSRGLRSCYEKLRLRDAIDFPELSVAAAARFDRDGTVTALRVCVSGLEPAPRLLGDVTGPFLGGDLDDAAIAEIAAKAEALSRPVRNAQMGPRYRRAMVRVLTTRALGRLRGVP